MKATIITFHCVPNFGAMLQSYAMTALFKNYFDVVEVLDYRPEDLRRPYKLIYTKTFRGFVSSLLNLPTSIIRNYRFDKFLKNIPLSTHRYTNNGDIQIHSDFLVLGSDQIWNLDILHRMDKTYFGILDKKVQTIAYAASIGKDQVTDDELKMYSQLTENIESIGVREEKAKEILKSAGVNKNISVVLDPTLMLSKNEWQKLEKKIKTPPKYLLIYSLLAYDETYQYSYKIAHDMNLEIIEILGRNIDFLQRRKHKIIATAGPAEFIYLIRNASYVVTDSFHGTAFSILFRKRLKVIPHKSKGGRMIELLKKIGAEECLYDYKKDNDSSFEWSEENNKLIQENIENSLSFINSAIRQFN